MTAVTPIVSRQNPPLPANWEQLFTAVLSDALDAAGVIDAGDGADHPAARRRAEDVRAGADRGVHGVAARRARTKTPMSSRSRSSTT